MFKFAIFLFFLCWISTGNPLKLKSLCNERVTRDGSSKVNAYYRIKLNQTLPPIGDYFPNATEIDENRSNSYVAPFVSQLKKHVKEIYSEKFMNSSNLAEKIREKQNFLSSIRENSRSSYDYNRRLPRSMYGNIDKVESLLKNLTKLNENNLTSDYLSLDELRSRLEHLVLDANQTSTFAEDFIDVFYERQLATLDGFRLNRGSQSIFLDGSSYGVIHYSLYLPFYDYNQQNIKSNCSCTDYLPKFFSIDTVPVEKNRTISTDSD